MCQFKVFPIYAVCITLLLHISCSEHSRVTTEISPKVFLEKAQNGYRIVRNERPFFIKGAGGNTYLQKLKEAGANTIRVYDTNNLKKTLDTALLYDLAVIIDVPIPRFSEQDTIFSDREAMQRLYESTQNFINAHKHHPALLYWMLGNEIGYPDLPGDNNLTHYFNALIDMVHREDPNHPVSTAVGGFNRSELLSLQVRSPSLDFMSINIFGELSTFEERKNEISMLWDGPYVFSELGINGPWEAQNTKWAAPIEETSTKKAEQLKHRYDSYIATIKDGRHLGSVFFYWGNKQERTHTWFSTLDSAGKKSEMAFVFENAWKNRTDEFIGPKIDYLLLNGKGAGQSIVLKPVENAIAELYLPKLEHVDYKIKWEVRKENWNYGFNAVEKRPAIVKVSTNSNSNSDFRFVAPKNDGPYRLYVTLEADNGYIATSNIPFYILGPTNE